MGTEKKAPEPEDVMDSEAQSLELSDEEAEGITGGSGPPISPPGGPGGAGPGYQGPV